MNKLAFFFRDLYFDSAIRVLKTSSLINFKKSLFLIFYYLLTFLNTILEGIGLILIVDIFTNGFYLTDDVSNIYENNFILLYLQDLLLQSGFEVSILSSISIIIILFAIRIVTYGTILLSDGFINAQIRKSLQEKIYRKYLQSSWEKIRSIQVGQFVNINGQEAVTTVKYFFSIIKSLYFFFTTFLFVLMAFIISAKITFLLFLSSLPMLILMQYIFKRQSAASKKFADERNIFLSDITDRLNGFLQIKVEDNIDYHFQQGTRSQSKLRKYEIEIAFYQAFIGLFIVLIPLVIFLTVYVMYLWNLFDANTFLPLLASVGILGVRALTQLNGLITSFANLSRLSGSLRAIDDVFLFEDEVKKNNIKEKIISISSENLTYCVSDKEIFKNVNLNIKLGEPFIIKGQSGVGKSTLVNLISGVIEPSHGKIVYTSGMKNSYNSRDFKAKIGYVTQDIYLFKGTVRDNLSTNQKISDNKIWEVLDQVNAAQFIQSLGGLDINILESGKSLSGGQRRRLGIARAILCDSSILICDEITAGLDKNDKLSIANLIYDISQNIILIIISHEDITIPNSRVYKLEKK